MQKHVNLVDLVESFPTNIFLQNLASIQKRTSPVKFAHLAEKSEKGSISNLSTKFRAACIPVCTACCMAAVLCTTDYGLRSGDACLRCARCGKSYGSVALLQPRPHARRNAARQGEPCFPGRSVRMRATATQSADRTDIVLSN